MSQTSTDDISAFARMLKFWRTCQGYSQEALSAAVGVSTRHLSFLETGKSNPSRVLVVDLATEFKLSVRDTNNLLVAANYFPVDSKLIVGAEKENYYIDKAAELSLIAANTPSCIQDATGNILRVNRDWLYFHQVWGTGFNNNTCTNSFELYLSNNGLRDHLVHWEFVASAVLLTLQLEILLTDDQAAQATLDRLLALPGIPADWQQIGAKVPYNHSFKLDLAKPDGSIANHIVVNNTLGATPYVSKPRRVMTSLNLISDPDPIDKELYQSLEHPLLAE